MAATLEIHFLTLKYTHCQFCQNYPKKVAKIKLILAKLAFATNYEVWFIVLLNINNVNEKDIPRPCIGNCFSTITNPNQKNC
jgi:hypothetical protein